MNDKLLKVLDMFEKRGIQTITWITYLILFFLNPGHKFTEVKDGLLYHIDGEPKKNIADIVTDSNVDLLLEEAGKFKAEEEKRHKSIDEKNKVLLTVSALLVTADAALFSRVEPRWVLLLPLLPIMVTIFLVVRYFRVQDFRVVDLHSIKWTGDTNMAKKNLANEYLGCASHLSPRNDFRIGIFRAATRALIIGIFLFLPVFIIAVFSPSNGNEALRALRSNSQIMDELRGPMGPQGPPGPQGQPGQQGLQGPMGPPCSSPTVTKPNQQIQENQTKAKVKMQ
jgi:hypothetical protein